MPKVSIVIPAYMPGAYLRIAIDSLVEQSFKDWEAIVVDDGSEEHISRYLPKSENVKLIRLSRSGVSVARNVGILNSSSEFVALLDADDVWLPTKLQRQLQTLEQNPNAAFCHTGFATIGPELKARNHLRENVESALNLNSSIPAVIRLALQNICTSSILIRRQCLSSSGLFDPLLSHSEDYDLYLRLLLHYEFTYVPSIQVLYRQHSMNTSANYQLSLAQGRRVFSRYRRFARMTGNADLDKSARLLFERLRTICGARAFDHCREDFRRREFFPCAKRLFESALIKPTYVAESLFKYVVGTKARLREEHHGAPR
ncbi:MAG TPA: glycosyltransferase family 2 protein [Candidatus Obscuribacterales bacterium]